MPRNPNVPNPEFGGLHTPVDEWGFTTEMLRALQTASLLHAAQHRKGHVANWCGEQRSVPYVAHLLAVCSIVLDYGGTEQEAIGALLHDAVEDIQPTELSREAVATFGQDVLDIVEGCTDGVPGDDGKKPDWSVRKSSYLRHLEGATASVLLVSAADKLHNARSTVADLRRLGPVALDKYNATAEQTLWYYMELVKAFTMNKHHHPGLVAELRAVVAEMWSLARLVGPVTPVPEGKRHRE